MATQRKREGKLPSGKKYSISQYGSGSRDATVEGSKTRRSTRKMELYNVSKGKRETVARKTAEKSGTTPGGKQYKSSRARKNPTIYQDKDTIATSKRSPRTEYRHEKTTYKKDNGPAVHRQYNVKIGANGMRSGGSYSKNNKRRVKPR